MEHYSAIFIVIMLPVIKQYVKKHVDTNLLAVIFDQSNSNLIMAVCKDFSPQTTQIFVLMSTALTFYKGVSRNMYHG